MGTIYVLWSGKYDERVAVAGFRSREAIPAWIGDLCLNRDLTPLDGPLEVTELELVEPEEFNATDLEAIASVIGQGRTGRPWHETRSTPGGVKDMETAREVAQVVGQRIADARAIAAQDIEQHAARPVAAARRQLVAALAESVPEVTSSSTWSELVQVVQQRSEQLLELEQDAQQPRGGGTQRDHLAAVLGESAPEAMDASWGRLMELVRERSERLAELETRPTVPGAGIARLAQWFVDRQFASQETGPTLARHAMDAYWGPVA